MSNRDRIALAVPPLLLRLVLAVTFIWAGLSKALTTMSISPEGAATLSSMGVTVNNAGPPSLIPIPAPSKPSESPAAPTGGSASRPGAPIGFLGAGFQNGGAGNSSPPFPADGFAKPKQESKPEQPAAPAVPAPGESKPAAKNPLGIPVTPPAVPPQPAQTTPITPPTAVVTAKTAADFPNPEPVRRVYGLALTVHSAANPPPAPAGPSGEPAPARMRLLPAELGQGSRPVYVAFTIAAIEIISGAMLLLGMLTRLWALAVAFVMVGAIWLTQIGPAIASGDAVLGFLPNRPWGDAGQWMPLFWNISLLGAALAVFFAGSGALAVDNAMFGRRSQPGDTDE
jgi:uncharacterized membrane protein YphA (DoxX/SURF4 family)